MDPMGYRVFVTLDVAVTNDFQDSSHSAFKALLRSRRTVKRASIKTQDRRDGNNKSGHIPNKIDLDEPRKKHLSTFHYTGWLIRILIMVYYNPYKIG